MSIVSIARVHLKSIRFIPVFLWRSFILAAKANNAPGNIGIKLRRSRGLTFWRLTLWEDYGSMEGFRNCDKHVDTEPKARRWFDEFAMVRLQQEGMEMPSWNQAALLLREHGRLCEVDEASKSQLNGEIDVS